jgi:hypothetical protein
MNKAVYAFAFLGLCAVVLVLHTNQVAEQEEALAEAVPQDPFLANLEAHVIAKAQRRLRQRAQAHKRKDHISNARKAMKTMLLNAASRAQDRVAKVEKEEELKRQKDKKKGAAATAKAAGGKQFTWAQLQNGDDNAKQNYAQQKMGNLLNKLKRAPKADKKKRLQDAEHKQEKKSSAMAKALHDAKKKAADDIKKKDVFA